MADLRVPHLARRQAHRGPGRLQLADRPPLADRVPGRHPRRQQRVPLRILVDPEPVEDAQDDGPGHAMLARHVAHRPGATAAAPMAAKPSGSREAPPTSAPSTSGCEKNSARVGGGHAAAVQDGHLGRGLRAAHLGQDGADLRRDRLGIVARGRVPGSDGPHRLVGDGQAAARRSRSSGASAARSWRSITAAVSPASRCSSRSPMAAMGRSPWATALATLAPTRSSVSPSYWRRSECPRITQPATSASISGEVSPVKAPFSWEAMVWAPTSIRPATAAGDRFEPDRGRADDGDRRSSAAMRSATALASASASTRVGGVHLPVAGDDRRAFRVHDAALRFSFSRRGWIVVVALGELDEPAKAVVRRRAAHAQCTGQCVKVCLRLQAPLRRRPPGDPPRASPAGRIGRGRRWPAAGDPPRGRSCPGSPPPR